MRGFSKAIVAGNLTRDPELRSTTSGNSVCGFAVAVNRVYRGADGENKEETSFIDCTAWGRTGETIAQYAKKGDALIVSGRLSQRSWEDKNGGGRRSRVEIVVEDFVFAGSGNRGGGSFGGDFNATSGNGAAASDFSASASSNAATDTIPDDIPEQIDLDEVPF